MVNRIDATLKAALDHGRNTVMSLRLLNRRL